MTSNVGTREIKKNLNYGFSSDDSSSDHDKIKGRIGDELKRLFNPEFLNRIDDVVFFHQLEFEQTLKIVDIVSEEMSQKVSDRNIKINLTAGAKKFIAENGFDPINGARPLKRAIQKYIEDPIADEILKGNFGDGSIIQIKMANKTELGFYEIGRKEDKKTDVKVD